VWFVSGSEVYRKCIDTINCTGQNVSENLLIARGEVDANTYLCSKDLRPSEDLFLSHFSDFALVTVNSFSHRFMLVFTLVLLKQ